MAFERIAKTAVALSAAGVMVLVAVHRGPTQVHAQNKGNDQGQGQGQDNVQMLATIGLRIAPDFIKLNGKDPTLVGYGSFIVNAQADCNGCHTSNPQFEFLGTNNPYFRSPLNAYPPKYDPATYMAGGSDFGPVGPGISGGVMGAGPDIISRNLTPDYTGNPEGGNDLQTFINILRTGHDYDKLHPNCGGTVTDNCYSFPVDGTLLQVMPWPVFQHMTDYQLTAIWTYLSTLPCNAHNDALGTMYPWLKNKCE